MNLNCLQTWVSSNRNSAIAKFIKILKTGKRNWIAKCLNTLQNFEPPHLVVLNRAVERICNGETLLHTALKFYRTTEIAKKIMSSYPKLLLNERDDNSGFEGQTPVHVAVVQGNVPAVDHIVKISKDSNILSILLEVKSTGKEFKNTALVGQLLLTVAALACNCECNNHFVIMKTLLEYGSKISWTNNYGDTVFHSLIKYADVYPDKMTHIKKSFEFLREHFSTSKTYCDGNDISAIRFLKNNAGFTPLHLSAKLGVSVLFDFIINIPGVYCFTNIQDDILDIQEYDVTEFDRSICYVENTEDQNAHKLTILESIFDSECNHQEAFQILDLQLVMFILQRKWGAYKTTLAVWLVSHLMTMILLTSFTIKKAEQLLSHQTSNQTSNQTRGIGTEDYGLAAMITVFGIFYFAFAFSCLLKIYYRCTNTPEKNFSLMYHNLDYVICLLVVSVGSFMEAFLIFLGMHLDYHLVLVLICGWYFMLYFAPFNKNLVSFTYMIKRGFFEDFLPFVTVELCLLVPCTGIMHMLFLGTDVEDFETFGNSLLKMFNLGVGLDNIDVLSQARVPWLAYTLFILFAILSFIHLFNALIAVMSQTFSDVHADKHSYLKYNKLRMIELFEDIVLNPVFRWLPCLKTAKHWKATQYDENGENNKQRENHENCKTEKENELDKRRFYSALQSLYDPSCDSDEREKKKETECKIRNIAKIVKEENLGTNGSENFKSLVTKVIALEKKMTSECL